MSDYFRVVLRSANSIDSSSVTFNPMRCTFNLNNVLGIKYGHEIKKWNVRLQNLVLTLGRRNYTSPVAVVRCNLSSSPQYDTQFNSAAASNVITLFQSPQDFIVPPIQGGHSVKLAELGGTLTLQSPDTDSFLHIDLLDAFTDQPIALLGGVQPEDWAGILEFKAIE